MKINKNEAELLAKEVQSMIHAAQRPISRTTLSTIETFCTKREELNKAAATIRTKQDNLRKAFIKEFPGAVNYTGSTKAAIIDRIKNAETPNVQEIVGKIVLKSMFSSPDDMKAFLEEIVKEYTKK